MKCMMMTATGGPEVLQLRDVSDPVPGPREVRVSLRAAGVNPVDTKLRKRGTYYPDRLPAILGCDGAGVVDAVGAGVTRFKTGDEVYFCNGGIGGDAGSYAQYTLVYEDYVARKPQRATFHEAAALPLVLITAWEALHDRAAMQSDDEVLIHAGAGGVGHVAIQLARAAGARVCTTISSDQKARFVRELGADGVVNYRTDDFVRAVGAWSQHGGARITFDTVGGATFTRSFEATRVYGDVVTLLQPDASVDWKAARNRNLRVSFELMLTPMFMNLHDARCHQAEILQRGAELFDAGKLRVHVSHVLPLADAARAHQLIEAGGVTGKIVLEIG